MAISTRPAGLPPKVGTLFTLGHANPVTEWACTGLLTGIEERLNRLCESTPPSFLIAVHRHSDLNTEIGRDQAPHSRRA